jgi:hypothetical protein
MKVIRTALIIFVISTISNGVFADAGPTKKNFQPLYDQFAKAMKVKNMDAAASHFLPTFWVKTDTGMDIRLPALKYYLKNDLFRMERITSVEYPIESIVQKGADVVVTGILRTVGTTVPDETGKTHVLSLTRQLRIVWTKTKTGWMASKGEQLRSNLLQDGKPYRFVPPAISTQKPIR